MSKPTFDERIEALEALRSSADSAFTREQLRKALNYRNNYLVARAAALIADLRLEELIPELLAAFDRFFVNPVKSDPQCLAKNAIAKALKHMGHRGAQAYLRGIVHTQFEPAWGGRADSAGTLRGTCALALADCELDAIQILTHLADALADPATLVRIDSAIAINQLGRTEGALLLRLKLLTGDREADVLGQCFASLLNLAPDGSVAFVSRFLSSADGDVQVEAASALAQCRDPEAIGILEEFWKEALISLELRRVLLINLGASPVPRAAEFLLSVVSNESSDLAASAIAALATSRFRAEIRDRVAATIAERGVSDLRLAFEQAFAQRVEHETPNTTAKVPERPR